MDNLIPKYYKSYGKYVNTEKMIPGVDGLIPVWRRLLYGAYKLARTDYVKSATLFGHVVGHWHPHSEDLRGPAQQLVLNNFLIGKGNWGSRIGVEPIECAAPRYTGIKFNDNLKKDFEFIKDVPYVLSELGYEEPAFIPTKIPFCLKGNFDFVSIGFGIKACIPSYKEKDLEERLENKKKIISPLCGGCDIISSRKEIKNILENPGTNKITIKGKYEVKNSEIILYSWNPRIGFKKIYDNIYEKFQSFTWSDESKEETKIVFRVNKYRDEFVKILDESVTDEISYNIFYVKEGKIINGSVDQYLEDCYSYYKLSENAYNARIAEELRRKEKENKLLKEIKKKFKIDPNFISALGFEKEFVEDVLSKTNIKALLEA